MRKRRKVWLVVAIAIASSIVIGGVFFVRAVLLVPEQAYAMYGAGDLLVQHLKLNTNAWPKSWSDLENTYRLLERDHSTLNTNGTVIYRRWDISIHSTFALIQKHVEIDWNVDAANLADVAFTDPIRPFRVVRLQDGSGRHFEGAEPNAMIWEYLQSVKTNLQSGIRRN